MDSRPPLAIPRVRRLPATPSLRLPALRYGPRPNPGSTRCSQSATVARPGLPPRMPAPGCDRPRSSPGWPRSSPTGALHRERIEWQARVETLRFPVAGVPREPLPLVWIRQPIAAPHPRVGPGPSALRISIGHSAWRPPRGQERGRVSRPTPSRARADARPSSPRAPPSAGKEVPRPLAQLHEDEAHREVVATPRSSHLQDTRCLPIRPVVAGMRNRRLRQNRGSWSRFTFAETPTIPFRPQTVECFR